MNPYQKRIRDFMTAIGQATPDEPTLEGYPFELRINLIEEEFREFAAACGYGDDASFILEWKRDGEPDMVGMIDGITDLLVVTFGAAVSMGVDVDPFMAEVMRANDSKLTSDGNVIRRESDGKVLKGPNYSPPDLASVLEHVKLQAARRRLLAEAADALPELSRPLANMTPVIRDYVRQETHVGARYFENEGLLDLCEEVHMSNTGTGEELDDIELQAACLALSRRLASWKPPYVIGAESYDAAVRKLVQATVDEANAEIARRGRKKEETT